MSTSQREITATYKKETLLNLSMLTMVRPMVPELSRLVFKESSLDKPTQNLFNYLSYYLVTIIDAQAASKLTWPLFDSKAERVYRNELYNFVCDNSNKGLSPVMSSYFVNPGCYKVTVLIFQLSQLALSILVSHMANDTQKKFLHEENEMYKSDVDTDAFVEFLERKTQHIQCKLSKHLIKRQILEDIASKLCKKIIELEKKIADTKGEEYINDLVDNFLAQHELNNVSEQTILSIKNVSKESPFFEDWLTQMDYEIDKLKNQWDNKAVPFLNTCRETSHLTESVVKRYTGQTEKSSYMISYNPKTDKISTKDLESQINVEQKYILKNLDIDGKLNFPNLIRAFVISISFVLKNTQVDDQIYKFNKYLEAGRISLHDIRLGLCSVMERISNAEERLQYTPPMDALPSASCNIGNIYPGSITGPSLSNLKAGREFQAFFDTFTPLASYKQKFNLNRSVSTFRQPMPLQPLKEDFMKSIISYSVNPNYDLSRNSNMSIVSQVKGNETIADCASGFTRHQIQRLLSTKKTSSSKKYKYSSERPANVKKVGLTYDSGVSIESNGLTRSYSSPNLFETREKRSVPRLRGRKLSIMKEDSPYELSGISTLDNDSNFSTPGAANAESSRKLCETPRIVVSNAEINHDNELNVDLSKETNSSTLERKSIENISKSDTPKTNPHLIRKTSSIEKIINRFKKVRASVIPPKDDLIREEKDNHKVGEKIDTTTKFLLPDLISPSYSLTEENGDSSDDDLIKRRPRESLGSVLGVDQTFLDQFDLID